MRQSCPFTWNVIIGVQNFKTLEGEPETQPSISLAQCQDPRGVLVQPRQPWLPIGKALRPVVDIPLKDLVQQ